MDIKEAIDTITKALREDPEYRISWVANIAIQFKDRASVQTVDGLCMMTSDEVHSMANEAAEGFISLLCKE
jgi:serine/threonine protein kinase